MLNAPEPPLTDRERALTQALEAERRKRRTVQLALAAAVLMLATCGGMFAWYSEQQAQEREAERRRAEDLAAADLAAIDAARWVTEARLTAERDAEARLKTEQARQAVATNLALAADLRKQFKFKEAEAALAQAARLASGGAPELLPQVEQARRDIAFVARLDDIRYRKWIWIAQPDGKGEFNTRIAPVEYRKAFVEHGLDLAALDPSEAAKRIASSAIRAESVAALDDWALYEPDAALRDKLLDVARRADPGPLTDRLRDPATRADRKAVAKLAEEVDLAATSPAVVLVVAELMRRRQLDPLPLLTATQRKHPVDFELNFALGQCHAASGHGQAIGAYRAAAAIQPHNATVWNNLGVALQNAGDLDGAVAAFRRVIELDPRLALAYANLGAALEHKGDAAGALAAYKRAIELDPQSALAHANLGTALARRGELAGAISAYKVALALDPTFTRGRLDLGNALRASGDVSGAIAAYKEAVRFDPAHAGAYFALGEALRHASDVPGATAAFRKATELDPVQFKHLLENPVLAVAPPPRAVNR